MAGSRAIDSPDMNGRFGKGKLDQQRRGRGTPGHPLPPPPRALPYTQLCGVIFGCTKGTIRECFTEGLFGLPRPHISYVKHIRDGLPLFLFDYSAKVLHGVFEAAGNGQENINPLAWSRSGGGKAFPAQVRVRIRRYCRPLPESVFRNVISENYYSDRHFQFELDHVQTTSLCDLFLNGGEAIPPYPFGVSSERDGSSWDVNSTGKAAGSNEAYGNAEENGWSNEPELSEVGGWTNPGTLSQNDQWRNHASSSNYDEWKDHARRSETAGWTNSAPYPQSDGWVNHASRQNDEWTSPARYAQDQGRTNHATYSQDDGWGYDDALSQDTRWTNPDASSQRVGWTNPSASSYGGGWKLSDPSSYNGGWTSPKASYDREHTSPKASFHKHTSTGFDESFQGGRKNPKKPSRNRRPKEPKSHAKDDEWPARIEFPLQDREYQRSGKWSTGWTPSDNPITSLEPPLNVKSNEGDSSLQNSDAGDSSWKNKDQGLSTWENKDQGDSSWHNGREGDSRWQSNDEWCWLPKVCAQKSGNQHVLSMPSSGGQCEADTEQGQNAEWLWEPPAPPHKIEMEHAKEEDSPETKSICSTEAVSPLKEGHDSLLLALQPIDSASASEICKKMEENSTVLTEIYQQGVDMRNLIEEVKSLKLEICNIKDIHLIKDVHMVQSTLHKDFLSITHVLQSLSEDLKEIKSHLRRALES